LPRSTARLTTDWVKPILLITSLAVMPNLLPSRSKADCVHSPALAVSLSVTNHPLLAKIAEILQEASMKHRLQILGIK